MRAGKKMRREESLATACLPVLYALSIRPMTTQELSFHMMLSRVSVRERTKFLEKNGLIVRRFSDKRWVIRVMLQAVVPVPEGADPKSFEPKRTVRAAEAFRALAHNIGEPGDVETGPEASRRRIAASEKSAKMLNVPAMLGGGRLVVGSAKSCNKCSVTTAIRYENSTGSEPWCAKCAREEAAKCVT